jgi:hypothetical protein
MLPATCVLSGNGKSLEATMLGEYIVNNSWPESVALPHSI